MVPGASCPGPSGPFVRLEVRHTHDGRPYIVDHFTKTTAWPHSAKVAQPSPHGDRDDTDSPAIQQQEQRPAGANSLQGQAYDELCPQPVAADDADFHIDISTTALVQLACYVTRALARPMPAKTVASGNASATKPGRLAPIVSRTGTIVRIPNIPFRNKTSRHYV